VNRHCYLLNTKLNWDAAPLASEPKIEFYSI